MRRLRTVTREFWLGNTRSLAITLYTFGWGTGISLQHSATECRFLPQFQSRVPQPPTRSIDHTPFASQTDPAAGRSLSAFAPFRQTGSARSLPSWHDLRAAGSYGDQPRPTAAAWQTYAAVGAPRCRFRYPSATYQRHAGYSCMRVAARQCARTQRRVAPLPACQTDRRQPWRE